MDADKIALMMNTIIMSQYSYCPLIMFHDKHINNQVNEIHE